MENDHSLKIAERLLALKASIAPTVEVIESLSEEMRQLVTENGNRQIEAVVAGLGVVSVSAAAAERLKGLEDVLNFANWLTLDDTERDRLRALKVVESVKVFSRSRKSAVTIRLDPRVAAAVIATPTISGELRVH